MLHRQDSGHSGSPGQGFQISLVTDGLLCRDRVWGGVKPPHTEAPHRAGGTGAVTEYEKSVIISDEG